MTQDSDVITQIQDQLSELCSMLFNFTGAVQVCCMVPQHTRYQ